MTNRIVLLSEYRHHNINNTITNNNTKSSNLIISPLLARHVWSLHRLVSFSLPSPPYTLHISILHYQHNMRRVSLSCLSYSHTHSRPLTQRTPARQFSHEPFPCRCATHERTTCLTRVQKLGPTIRHVSPQSLARPLSPNKPPILLGLPPHPSLLILQRRAYLYWSAAHPNSHILWNPPGPPSGAAG